MENYCLALFIVFFSMGFVLLPFSVKEFAASLVILVCTFQHECLAFHYNIIDIVGILVLFYYSLINIVFYKTCNPKQT